MREVRGSMEFRSSDDSWYAVELVVNGDSLTVKYHNYPDEEAQAFRPKDFKSVDEVEEFATRFRLVSEHVQDRECSKIVEGMLVCASCSFDNGGLHYYDAIVEQVEKNEHSNAKGEEECLCTFVLCWQHGPNAGNLMYKSIDGICLLQSSAQRDLKLSSFLKMARDRIQVTSPHSGSISEVEGFACKGGSCPEQIEMIHNSCALTGVDTDFGGYRYHYCILVENLDKELSTTTIVDFINNHTSIKPQVYVFPTLSSEPYTRGVIMLDCKENFVKLCSFLDNPNHIIVSARGRPLVITDRISSHDSFRISIATSLLKSQIELHNIGGISAGLKVVYVGSEEYTTVKQLKDLYTEFADHLHRLQKRLADEEREIMHSSHRVSK